MTGALSNEPSRRPAEAWTVKRLMDWAVEYLRQHNPDSTRYDVELLLSEALEMNRVNLYVNFDKPIDQAERDVFKSHLLRAARGEPVAYVLGRKEFMGHVFKVSPAVLIPRADTEVLVEKSLEHVANSKEKIRILDLGAGSGCIGISLALALPEAEVEAWDVSPEAMRVAEANASELGAGNYRVKLRDMRLDAVVDEPFDLIVSNPPYVSEDEKQFMSRSTLEYEPGLALFAEDRGLAFYRSILRRCVTGLKPGGGLLLEIGFRQADSVCDLVQAAGIFSEPLVHKDYSGHDRVVEARRREAP